MWLTNLRMYNICLSDLEIKPSYCTRYADNWDGENYNYHTNTSYQTAGVTVEKCFCFVYFYATVFAQPVKKILHQLIRDRWLPRTFWEKEKLKLWLSFK